MNTRSTLYGVVEALLNEQGTSFDVLAPDMLEDGNSYEDITYAIRERTSVPISSRTVRRWAERLGDAA